MAAITQARLQAGQSRLSRQSTGQSTLPPEYDIQNDIELRSISSSSSEATLPQYEDAVQSPPTPGPSSSSLSAPGSLYTTHSFQIETRGHPLVALPLPPRPDPIEVYSVGPDGQIGSLAYESIRYSRGSGNCALVHAGDSSESPLCTTTYRFGPSRPPKIQLLQSASCDEEFEVISKGCATRSQTIRTHLGTFEWRHASRKERQVVEADSLLVMDLVTTVALVGGKQEKRHRRVAHLVRNAEFRSQGSKKSTAGNGGRLVMDLRDWMGGKLEVEQMELLVISSCITMLKKEVDRRRMMQVAVIAGGAGGS